MSRRLVLRSAAALAAAVSIPAPGEQAKRRAISFDLHTATIADVNAAFDTGVLTAESLLRLYLRRIEAFNLRGPVINAFIRIQPEALRMARELDEERRRSGPRSPLHGVPIVLKDLFNTCDLPTSGGFAGLAMSQPDRDATVVRRLRNAGAIILGKTNLNDWFGRPKRGAQSTLAGRTRNPYNLRLSPGGSSGGSAAAVAAVFAQAALGTETGVSVRNPASNNGLVALVATRGAVSRAGVLMASFLQDRPGPMARSVHDVAVLADCLMGFDAEDLATQAVLGRLPGKSFTQEARPDALSGARIGVLRDLFRTARAHHEGNLMVEGALAILRRAGATIVDPVRSGLDLRALLSDARTTPFETRHAHDLYLRQLGPRGTVHSVDELVAKFGSALAPSVGAVVHPDLDHNSALPAVQARQRVIRDAVVGVLERERLDALVYPFKTLPATDPLGHDGGELDSEHDNPLSAVTGLPAMVLPLGVTRELGAPIALELLGREFSEATLFRLAFGCERVLPPRVQPRSTPALDGERFVFHVG